MVGDEEFFEFFFFDEVVDEAVEVAVAGDDDGFLVMGDFFHGLEDEFGVAIAFGDAVFVLEGGFEDADEAVFLE